MLILIGGRKLGMETFDSDTVQTSQQVKNTGMPVSENLPMIVLIYTNNILYFPCFFFVALMFLLLQGMICYPQHVPTFIFHTTET